MMDRTRARAALRSGDWITRERVRLVAALLLIAASLGFAYLVVTAHGGVDVAGRPLGTDFSNVYAAGTFVDQGEAAKPFDPPTQYAREQAIFGAATQFYGWHYPPYFLFVAGALAKLPYGLALAVWQAGTLLLYLLMIWAIALPSPRVRDGEGAFPLGSESRERPLTPRAGRGDYLWLLLALAFPAVLINVGHGQNGFLTAALLGGALVLLDRRPLVAGILFGLLVYKPQFGFVIPIALVAGGRWRCFAAAAATVAVLTLVTTLAFGPHIWNAFLASTHFTRTVALEQGNTGWQKIQSVFAWARMWGAPIPLAYALQGLTVVVVGAALARLWHGAVPAALKAAGLCIAAILATPYSFDYDMVALAPAIAFLAADGRDRGFSPYEKTALAALWLVPLIARSFAQATAIPLGVPAMLAVFLLILRRAELDATLAMAFRPGSSKMTAGAGTRDRSPGHDIAALKS